MSTVSLGAAQANWRQLVRLASLERPTGPSRPSAAEDAAEHWVISSGVPENSAEGLWPRGRESGAFSVGPRSGGLVRSTRSSRGGGLGVESEGVIA